MTIDESGVAVSSPASGSTSRPSTSDERWAAWEAKGAAHDRALRRRIAVAAPFLFVVAAVVIYALLGR